MWIPGNVIRQEFQRYEAAKLKLFEWPGLKSIIDTEIEYQKVAKNAGDDCGCEVALPVPGLAKPAVPGLPKKK